MGKTNSLTSHHGESRNFRDDKMVPVETMRWFNGCKSGLRKFYKRFYKKKSREHAKYTLRKELEDNSDTNIGSF